MELKIMLSLLRITHTLSIMKKSIHASKVLEADYVILCQMGSGAYEFPSVIQNDPLINTFNLPVS